MVVNLNSNLYIGPESIFHNLFTLQYPNLDSCDLVINTGIDQNILIGIGQSNDFPATNKLTMKDMGKSARTCLQQNVAHHKPCECILYVTELYVTLHAIFCVWQGERITSDTC